MAPLEEEEVAPLEDEVAPLEDEVALLEDEVAPLEEVPPDKDEDIAGSSEKLGSH